METQHHATKQNLTWKLQHKFKKLECQHGTINKLYIYTIKESLKKPHNRTKLAKKTQKMKAM